MFHHNVAQLLFISERSRLHIVITLTFLNTILNILYHYDWGKLKRVLKYLKGIKHMKLNLTVDLMSVIHWWVDTRYIIQCSHQL